MRSASESTPATTSRSLHRRSCSRRSLRARRGSSSARGHGARLDDPIRVYERFATLDAPLQRSRGMTLGRRVLHRVVPLFGYNLADYERLFGEAGPVPRQAGRTAVLMEAVHAPARERRHLPNRLGSLRSGSVRGSPESVTRRGALPVRIDARDRRRDRRFAHMPKLYRRSLSELGAAPFRSACTRRASSRTPTMRRSSCSSRTSRHSGTASAPNVGGRRRRAVRRRGRVRRRLRWFGRNHRRKDGAAAAAPFSSIVSTSVLERRTAARTPDRGWTAHGSDPSCSSIAPWTLGTTLRSRPERASRPPQRRPSRQSKRLIWKYSRPGNSR